MTYYNKLITAFKMSKLGERTQESYTRECRRFFREYDYVNPPNITESNVKDWLLELKIDRKFSPSALNISKNGLRFFFTYVLPRPEWTIFIDFKTPVLHKKRCVLSIEEVWRILNAIETPHNRSALVLIYLCGLRISECTHLEISDVHAPEMQLFVHLGKGAKDRFIPLPTKALELLRTHYKTHRNPKYIFPARGRGGVDASTSMRPLPLSSIQTVFKRVLKEVGIIKRNVTVHTLRHSYATHLIELGVPLQHVQYFLGHTSLQTTEKYLHITPQGMKKSLTHINTLAEPYHEV
jgi:integrase/recombinase XerD